MLESWQTPHFDQKIHICISISNIVCILINRKYPKHAKLSLIKANQGLIKAYFISGEPLMLETWQTPQFNQKDHVSISVSYIPYLSDNRKCSKCPNRVKRDQKGVKRTQNLYLANHWSQKLGRPLNLSRKCMFLLVFHIFHTSQMTGSAQKCPNIVKMGQKKGKKAISH